MKTQIFKSVALIALSSNFLIASSCSNGLCGITRPHIPNDIQNNTQLKPFNFSGKKQINKGYNAWAIIDNGGDKATGENRFMSGIDINSLFDDRDKLSLFGLISSESLKSGKLSYAYTLPWDNLIVEASYINTNYSLGEPFPDATGIGTTHSIEGKITYPFINSKKGKLNFSLYLNNNNIEEEIDNTFNISNNEKKSYSATALIDFETENYLLFNLNTNQKLSLGLTTGNLSFDNKFNKEIDKLGDNVQGVYTKINIDYENTISLSQNTSIKSNFRSQYALNDKNLDDSESFTIGGTTGVKIYEEGSVYASNGFFFNVEGQYKLPEIKGVKNTLGAFYEYGKIWQSNSILTSNDETIAVNDENIAVQDTGIGIYTSYKKFFSKIQVAFKVGDSEISTKDDENYEVLFQAGIVF